MEIITAIGTVLGIAAVIVVRDFRDGKNIFRKNDASRDVDADNRNALQPLYSKMDELAQYANHETTEHTALLREIRDSLKDGFGDVRAKHKEWDVLGIPTRDCIKK